MEFWFCEKCGKRVTGEDMKGGAVRGDDGKAYCQDCKGAAAPVELPMPEEAAVPLPRVPAAQTAVLRSPGSSRTLSAVRSAPVPRKGESGTYRPATRGGELAGSGRQRGHDDAPPKKDSNSKVLAGSIGAAILIVTVMAVALSSSSGNTKPGAAADASNTATASTVAVAPSAPSAPSTPTPAPPHAPEPASASRPWVDPTPNTLTRPRVSETMSEEARKEAQAEEAFTQVDQKLKSLSDNAEKADALDEFIKQHPDSIISARARTMRDALRKPAAAANPPPAQAPAQEDTQTVVDRAEAKRKEHDLPGAIAEYTAAIEAGSRQGVYFQNRADAKRAAGDFEGCLADITQALELGENSIGWKLRAICCYGLRQDEAYRRCLEKAATLDNKDAAAIEKQIEQDNQRARLLCDGKTFETKTPSTAEEFRSRGAYRIVRGNRDAGMADLQEALKRDPSLGAKGLAMQIAESYRADKKYDAVLSCYKSWAESKPETAEALNAYAWELLTSPDPKLVDAKSALPLAEKAVQLSASKDPNILDTVALAYSKNNRFRAALAAEEKAVQLLPADIPPDVRQQFEQRLNEFKAIEGKNDDIGRP